MLMFCVIAVWCFEALEWVFFQFWTMPFGLAGAVLDFNRVSAFFVVAARRWLGIRVLGFYDDFKITEPRECVPSAEAIFCDFVHWFGLKLDDAKAQWMSFVTKFLGSFEIFDCEGSPDLLAFIPIDDRVKSISETITEILNVGRVPLGRLSFLRGRLTHLASSMTGRLGHSVGLLTILSPQ